MESKRKNQAQPEQQPLMAITDGTTVGTNIELVVDESSQLGNGMSKKRRDQIQKGREINMRISSAKAKKRDGKENGGRVKKTNSSVFDRLAPKPKNQQPKGQQPNGLQSNVLHGNNGN